jgi:dolichol kinase
MEDIVDLTSGLYRFLLTSETVVSSRAPVPSSTAVRLRREAQVLLRRLSLARERAGTRLEERLDDLSRSLREMVATLRQKQPTLSDLKGRWQSLGEQYEELLAHVRRLRVPIPRGTEVGHIKPRNLSRNVFHATTGVVGICLYEFLLSREQTLLVGGTVLALFVTLEIVRRFWPACNERLYKRMFFRLSRPGEAKRAATSVWYMAGLVLGVWLLPKHAVELGTLVLAFGDPAASLAGKRWGRRKLVADKSLVGSLTFFLVAAVLCMAFMWWRVPLASPTHGVLIALAVAAAGAMTELASTRLNDNLSIPLIAGAVAALLL